MHAGCRIFARTLAIFGVSIILAGLALMGARDACANGERGHGLINANSEAQDLSSWIASEMHLFSTGGMTSKPVLARWTTVTTSSKSRSQAEADFAKVAPFPDHPDRILNEYHLQLHKNPERSQWTVYYKDRSCWMAEEVSSLGTTRRGGTDVDRWTYFVPADSREDLGAALNVVRSGVAFPSIFNAARYLTQTESVLGLALAHDLPRYIRWNVDARVGADGANVAWLVGGGPGRIRVSAERNPNPQNADPWRVVSIEHDAVASGSQAQRSVRYEYAAAEQASAVPQRIVVTREDGVVETTTEISIEFVESNVVRAASSVPAARKNTQIRDFRSPNAELMSAYETMPLVTWQIKEDEDQYRSRPAPNLGMGGADPRDMPNANSRSWLYPGISAVGIVTVMLVAWKWRLRNPI